MNWEQWGAVHLVIGNVWAANGHIAAGLLWLIVGALAFFIGKQKMAHA